MAQSDFFTPVRTWGPAVLISMGLHAVALYLVIALPLLSPPAKRVVNVDTICLSVVTPKPEGGGQRAGGPKVEAPPPPAVRPTPPPPKPTVAPKPKKRVRQPPAPEPVPVPPSLAMARPAPPVTPAKPAGAATGASSTSADRGRRGSGSEGGSGAGRGTGVGSGGGTGTGRGTGSGSALQGYLHRVRGLLERNKIYPPMARRRHEQGVVVVRFTIAADGGVSAVAVVRSSGHSLLDQAARETVSRVRQFPPLPRDVQRTILKIEVPISYRLEAG